MTLQEILDLLNSEGWNVAKIAKEKLPFGQKKLADVLKEVDFVFDNTGSKGWKYEGDPMFLEEDIMNFVDVKPEKVNAKNKNNASNNDSRYDIMNNNKKDIDNNSNNNDIIKNEIKSLIVGKKSGKLVKVYKGVYFDKDIADFIDSVPLRNRSEVINKVMRSYLKENDLF